MEITIGRNPPGVVTVDLRRSDALTKLHQHTLTVRALTETDLPRVEVELEANEVNGLPKQVLSGVGETAYGHLVSKFERDTFFWTSAEAAPEYFFMRDIFYASAPPVLDVRV